MMTFLFSQSFTSDTDPTRAVLSENFWRWQLSVEYVKNDVHRVKRKGERAVPWGAPDHLIGHTVLRPRKLGPVSEVVGDSCSQLVTDPRSGSSYP